ncbi:MAG: amidohydrolase family protein, partial [Geodermatophilales bacterium]|nr:amidohydrolase family protein [Geodermatophilales bacterium]
MTTYWCEHAQLAAGPVAGVRVGVADGRIVTVDPGVDPAPGDQRLPGVVLPGFANAHSHAFHRALRGRTHDRGGTFWSWRDRMYAVAARLDPDSYLTLARAVYAEMVLAGVTCVGEFHYLHHPVGGRRYDDPNAMS